MEYFKNLENLLKLEYQEDLKQYRLLTESSTISERKANGLTWYPVAIRGNELDKADYLILEIERTNQLETPHQFRNGMPISFFSNHDPKVDKIEGIVTHSFANRLKIKLKIDELPDWSKDGKLGIDVLFDENPYKEMREALKKASIEAQNNELIQTLIGLKKPVLNAENYTIQLAKLNESQQDAVNNILNSNTLSIIHGPPGTGKTTTLIQAILLLAKRNHKILVVAPSNTAVDLVAEQVSMAGLEVLRVGNPSRVSEKLQSLTLEYKITNHTYSKESKKLKKQAQEFKNMAHKYKRNFGKAEREQRKALFDEAHRIMKEVEKTEQYIIEEVLKQTQVVTATLVGSNHYTVRDLVYDFVIIDEAGQALEPACWIPILKGQKLILAGDHCQLPPTIKSEEAAQQGLSKTLLEKLIESCPSTVNLLDTQYRMNGLIAGYSSQIFYENKLKTPPHLAFQTIFKNDKPLLFLDSAGCGFEEKLEGTSSTNPEEAVFLINYLEKWIIESKELLTVQPFPSIGIVSPYKKQVQILQELLLENQNLKPYLNFININTIDSFQGQERDCIMISLVRSNQEGNIGFLSDIRRMNVAMTRAKKKLVVVGDSGTLSKNIFYDGFIDYAQQHKGYFSAWEFLN